MSPSRFIPFVLLVPALTSPAVAKDAGGFVVKLGNDTTAVESYLRTPERLEVEQVARSPRVSRRRYAFDFDANGNVSRFSIALAAPGSAPGAPPAQTFEGTCTAESTITVMTRGANTQTLRVATPPGTLPTPFSSPWAIYQHALTRLASGKSDTLGTGMWFVGAATPNRMHLRRLGRDSVEVTTDHDDVFRMRVDRQGRLLGSRPIAGTGQFSVERVEEPDLAAFAAGWAAAEKSAGTMGTLSTRDTVTATVAGAALWIDYGRPSKRGRVVFGGLVPFGEVWRTGANAATQFRTDRALEVGGRPLPAGTYTLWTIPSAKGWKLVVNSETGQWGTDHKADKDLFTVDIPTSTLHEPVERFTISIEPGAAGGTLHLDWDTTRASVAFRVAAN